MSLPGSCHAAADQACGAAISAGLSRLKAQILAEIARKGGINWQNNAQLQALETIRRPDGKPYHVESLGRADRELRSAGYLETTRVYAGQPIPAPGAKYRSAHGTTVKRLLWSALNLKNPLTRRERAQARAQQRADARASEMIAPSSGAASPAGPAEPRPAPRFSAAVPQAPAAPLPLPPELAELAESIGNLIDRRETAREVAHDAAQVLAAQRARAGPD